MDPFELGKLIGEIGRDVDTLKTGQVSLKSQVHRLRRAVLLLAIWSSAINGAINSDQISDVLVLVLKKAWM